MKIRLHPSLLLLVIFDLCGVSRLQAQSHDNWKVILAPPADAPYPSDWSGVFLNRDFGIINQGVRQTIVGALHDPLFRTTDGGNTWTRPKTDPILKSYFGPIQTFFMRDRSTGWFTWTNTDEIGHGIHKTTDGGESWTAIPDSSNWFSVVETLEGRLVTTSGQVAFKDEKIGITNQIIRGKGSPKHGFHDDKPAKTYDGGQTWQNIDLPGHPIIGGSYGWLHGGLHFDAVNGRLYLTEGHQFENDARFLTSDDFGDSWTLRNYPCRRDRDQVLTTNAINGANGLVYIATPCGVMRTADGGLTWKVVGPPAMDEWSIIVPKPCAGAVVIAKLATTDEYPSSDIWMTTNGGDGTIELPADTIKFDPIVFQTVEACDTGYASLNYNTCGCAPSDIRFDSVKILGDARFSVVVNSSWPRQWNGLTSSDTIRLQFVPQNRVGLAIAQVHLYGRIVRDSTEVSFDSIISISANSIASTFSTPELSLTPSEVDFGALDICGDINTTFIELKNTGCAELAITQQDIAGSGFTVQALRLPTVLPVDSSLVLNVGVIPLDQSPITATITFAATTSGGTKQFALQLKAHGYRSKKLINNLSSLDSGPSSICEELDSVIHLTNNGCDTLTITSADVDKNFNVGGSYPIVLVPGESIDVPITTIVDTAGRPRVLTGNLTITSTADNQIAPITLTRRLYYPTKLRIEAVDETSGKADDVVKFRVLLQGQVPSTMTSLHFDFLHNNDLLSWDRYDGIGLNRTNISGNENEKASFTLSPVHEGVIGEFTFKTRLALAEQTTLSFDKISFDAKGVSVAPECIAVISDSGSRFNYIYTCGDNIIRDRLNGTRLIKSITPNPAKDEIRVVLNVAGSAEISVFNALGVEVVKTGLAKIDVSGLADGVYYVRVASGGSVETRRIVINR